MSCYLHNISDNKYEKTKWYELKPVRNWVGKKEKWELGGVVHVKSSWRGDEVYVASGNHFTVAHKRRECVYVCCLAVFMWAAGLWGPIGCVCVVEIVSIGVFTYTCEYTCSMCLLIGKKRVNLFMSWMVGGSRGLFVCICRWILNTLNWHMS